MATSAARKAAPARKSPAARPRRAAAAAKPKRAASRAPAAEAAAPLNAAKAAVEPAPKAKAKAAEPKPGKPNGQSEPKKSGSDGAAESKKLKLVRDSFTLPKVEYGVIGVLKTRAARLGHPAKKSEIVRAGVKALAEMDDAQFLACVSMLPAAKPPRNKP